MGQPRNLSGTTERITIDSAERHPQDLVDYYRAHMRHTRDAGRSGVIDPAEGLPDSARKALGKRKTMSALYTAAAALDDEGDNWIAVFYSAAHAAQFTELCEQLGIKRIERDAWR